MQAVMTEIGQKYGRLTIVGYAGKTSNYATLVKCKCDCGNEKIVKLCHLKSSAIKSCGCLQKELLVERNHKGNPSKTTHRKSRTRLYRIWQGMKQRCFNDKSVVYKWYGAKGISICEEWKNDFQAFYDWAINIGYALNLTIDRINTNGNYEPQNCRWITQQNQLKNTSRNKKVIFKGEEYIVQDLCQKFNIPYSTAVGRLSAGWSVEDTFLAKRYERCGGKR